MRRILSASAALLSIGLGSAFAQAPPPVGVWTTADNGARFLIQPDGTCSFAVHGGVQVAGTCTWDPAGQGGVLAIWYPTISGPAAVRYSVVWVDDSTISVYGDVFHRRQ